MPDFIRKSIRLQGYDYSQNGAYFITICTLNKQKMLWEDNGWQPAPPQYSPPLSEIGMLVNAAILNIPLHYPNVTIENYTILPNHVHMILVVWADDNNIPRVTSVSTIIKQLKGYVSKTSGNKIWQKSFYDRVIRDDREAENIMAYINTNPSNWETDYE